MPAFLLDCFTPHASEPGPLRGSARQALHRFHQIADAILRDGEGALALAPLAAFLHFGEQFLPQFEVEACGLVQARISCEVAGFNFATWLSQQMPASMVKCSVAGWFHAMCVARHPWGTARAKLPWISSGLSFSKSSIR